MTSIGRRLVDRSIGLPQRRQVIDIGEVGAEGTGPSGGGADTFVTRIATARQAVVYSTYVGGNGQDFANGIAIDAEGRWAQRYGPLGGGLNEMRVTTADGSKGTAIYEVTGASHHHFFRVARAAGLPPG